MNNLNDIAPGFSFVLDKGLSLKYSSYEPNFFGNARIVMEGKPFSLQFTRDRGHVFVDIGSDSIGWHKLEHVLEYLDSSITECMIGEPPNPAILADVLRDRWDLIARLFTDPDKLANLQEFSRQKTASFLGQIFGNP